MKQLAILEDDLEFSRKLLNYTLSNNKKVRLVNLAVDIGETIEILELLDEKDILLLDLNVPGINMDELVTLLKKKRNHIPYIIVIADNAKQYEKLRKYLYASIKRTCPFNKISNVINNITYETEKQNYERLVDTELSKFEINVTTIGYDYLVDAIILSLKDETLLKNMKNKLYKIIAKKNNIDNSDKIKWSIEKCVKSTIRYTNCNITNPYFRVEVREKITPKLFISMVVYNLKTTMEEEMDA